MAHNIQRAFGSKKKSAAELEAESFERQQELHISKAINSTECAPKEKHIRGIILGTFHDSHANLFFSVAQRSLNLNNHIICWKYLYVIHKLMRDGHANVIKDIERNITHLKDLSQSWGANRVTSYGRLIAAFCRLLLQKARFQLKYKQQIPGNLEVAAEDLARISGDNVNTLFELTVDIIDYVDQVIQLETHVLQSLDSSRSNSMTPCGQCKLTPLLQCIQDVAALYDLLVKLLFKLHARLDPDTLSGHRTRFIAQHTSIRKFFLTASRFQYYRNLIRIPLLPENPPNFLVQSELTRQKELVVKVADTTCEEEEDEADANAKSVDDLIDVDDNVADDVAAAELANQQHSRNSSVDDQFDKMFGRDLGRFDFGPASPPATAAHADLLNQIEQLKAEIERLKLEHCEREGSLKERISALEEEMKKVVQLKQSYEEQIEQFKANKANETTFEEKFSKMREVYNRLREEHISLLRKQGDTSQLEQVQEELRAANDRVAHLEHERVALSDGADEGHREIASLRTRIMDLERANTELESRAAASRTQTHAQLAQLQEEVTQLETQRITGLETQSGLETQLAEATASTNKLSGKLAAYRSQLELSRGSLLKIASSRSARLLHSTVTHFLESVEMAGMRGSAEYLINRIDALQCDFDELSKNVPDFAVQKKEALEHLTCSLVNIGHCMAQCLVQSKAAAQSSANQDQSGEQLKDAAQLASASLCTLLETIKENATANPSSPASPAAASPSGSSSVDQKLVAATQSQLGADSPLANQIAQLRACAERLLPRHTMSDVDPSEIGDLIDQEMQSTQEAIEAAETRFRELLDAQKRSGVSGVQLEVNERILDSCSRLMECIKILVEKAKVLQREIVAEGQGTDSAKEFYKKHHRWTEGLISAAKAVGLGATVLCDVADKMISGRAKLEELIVCSQEIAFSTTQLVIASRVKSSNPRSFSLQQLEAASKGVKEATGNVLASGKSAIDYREQTETYDFTGINLTQFKRLEMESQVKVLELESSLTKERQRLGELRKQHYQLAESLSETNTKSGDAGNVNGV